MASPTNRSMFFIACFHSCSKTTRIYSHFDIQVKKQEEGGYTPLSDASRMKDLLIDLVAMLPQPKFTFLIIDALDECLLKDRIVLLEFLEQVCDRTTSTRILTSARASQVDQSEELFPKTAVPICSWELPLPQRDRYIAEFLVNHYMRRRVTEDVCQLLVEELTSRMQGCAIWARMTLKYLATRRRTSVDTIQSYLEKNELPTRLKELYLGVFENVTEGDGECKWLLARSLELIAGARRRLTFDALLYALSLYTLPSKGGGSHAAKNLAELRDNLRKEVDERRIRQLLRSFADLEPTVEFVHHSLKDAVLELPALTDAAPPRQQGWTGGSGIEGVMLKTCVGYLMLDDFNWTETTPNDPRDEFPGCFPRISQVHQKMCQDHLKMSDESELIAGAEDERGSAFSVNSLTESQFSSNTDPFGAFFNYAAHYWKAHLGGAPVDFNLDGILELTDSTSARRRAWVIESRWCPSSMLRQPGWVYDSPHSVSC